MKQQSETEKILLLCATEDILKNILEKDLQSFSFFDTSSMDDKLIFWGTKDKITFSTKFSYTELLYNHQQGNLVSYLEDFKLVMTNKILPDLQIF